MKPIYFVFISSTYIVASRTEHSAVLDKFARDKTKSFKKR